MTPGVLVSAIGCTPQLAVRYAEHLNEACERFAINTPARQVDFLAHVAHESGGFSRALESLNYSVEALLAKFGRHRISEADARAFGRTASRPANQPAIGNALYGGEWGARQLGNTQPGDGFRYRGRGLIQITGRFNYAAITNRIRRVAPDAPDFEAEPAALELPRWAALSAGAFWDREALNLAADAGDFEAQTRAINGGLNGLADRQARRARAQAVLFKQPGAQAPVAPLAPAVPQPTATPAPPAAAAPGPQLPKEPAMVAPFLISAGKGLFAVLGQSLISALTPLASEKISREIGRHTDNPEVAEQISTALVTAAQTATGLADPIEAVAAAKQNPDVMAQVEESALDQLQRMGPLLERLAALDHSTWAAEESSRDAAAARAKGEEFDMAKPLLLAVMAVVGALILLVGGIVIAQVFKTGTPDTATWSALTGLIGWATGVAGSIYVYRFGTSRSSSAKDVVIAEMSRRKAPL